MADGWFFAMRTKEKKFLIRIFKLYQYAEKIIFQ